MKSYKVEFQKKIYTVAGQISAHIMYAFWNFKDAEKTIIEVLNPLTSCKSYLHDIIKSKYINNGNSLPLDIKCNTNFGNLDTHATRLVIGFNTNMAINSEEQVLKSLELIHSIESLIKCKKTVIIHKCTGSSKLFFIRASKYWMRSPEMISLYTLLWRVFSSTDFTKPITYSRTDELIKSITLTKNINYEIGAAEGDLISLKRHLKLIIGFLKNHRKIHGCIETETLYSKCSHGSGILESIYWYEQLNYYKNNHLDYESNTEFLSILNKSPQIAGILFKIFEKES